MGRSNVVSVEPGKEDIRDEFPEASELQIRSDTQALFFPFYCLTEREHPPLECSEIKDGGATVKAKVRVRSGSVRR